MTDYGNRMLPIEPVEEPNDEVEQVVEPETKEIVEEPIFDRPEKKEKKKRVMSEDAKQKLRDRLAKAREKSLAVRKAKAEEKKKNKKPVGRPKKVKEEEIPTTKVVLEDKTEVSFPTPEPEEEPKNEVVMQVKEQQPQTEKPVDNHNKIDYDKIINGIYEKMKPKEQPKPVAEKTYPSPRQRQQDLEARIRADERMRIKQEQEQSFKQKQMEKQAKLRKATHNYYSRLPQSNFFEPTDWDNLFNPK